MRVESIYLRKSANDLIIGMVDNSPLENELRKLLALASAALRDSSLWVSTSLAMSRLARAASLQKRIFFII